MIRLLTVQNLAVIRELVWEPAPGFNALSGETGAGKSIVVDALSLLAGQRADRQWVGPWASVLVVEAEIQLPGDLSQKVDSLLERSGIPACEEGILRLKRVVSPEGPGRQFVNGACATLQLFRELGSYWIEIEGPYAPQLLLSPENQLALLDRYAGLGEEVEAFEERFALWQKLGLLARKEEENAPLRTARKRELQKFLSEVEELSLEPGEEERLSQELQRATYVQELLEISSGLAQLLEEGQGSVLSLLANAQRFVGQWARRDPSRAQEAIALLENATVCLKELALQVSRYASSLPWEPGALAALEARFSRMQELKRRYGVSFGELVDRLEEAKAELDLLEEQERRAKEIVSQTESLERELGERAELLHKHRFEAAAALAQAVSAELGPLGFGKSSLRVEVQKLPHLRPAGADQVEFLFLASPHLPPSPLRDIASSGELARVLLALKCVLSVVDPVPVIVFDELDAHVGGETAWQVAQRLKTLAKNHQVLCVTHQPQLASQADAHFAIPKTAAGFSLVLSPLKGEEQEEELARMLGGRTQESLALARAMVSRRTAGLPK
ncbi:DNA repair protein RecN [Candidatus Methylacidithermus pantelleriae]|uniref:DNA repair protein RecN n=1 Tax=Candidatus Methylacidithermus pantelleriae TaxID=2744239 RepID=A0A8J2BH90_9BACT|nr:DNA repair protein RecN [Candidatus Methylacidithermus pantelleriae]CAF0689375.1 DNA repair protein RecN [Candidatus Methylacidithermus pantelleriae]